jgi:outer membrane protein
MKRFFLGFAIMMLMTAVSVQAQAVLKLGHVNKQEILTLMPETDSAQKKLDKIAKDLQDQMEKMQVEFNKKYEDYMANASNWSELIRNTKETELQDMNQRIQNFQSVAQQDIQQQQAKLFKPIVDKLNAAISDVAKEGRFTYIFDVSQGSFVVFQSADSQDITPLVKKKLGITK